MIKMSWKNVIKEYSEKDRAEYLLGLKNFPEKDKAEHLEDLRRLMNRQNAFNTVSDKKDKKKYDTLTVEQFFEEQLKQRGGKLTPAKANRLMEFYEKLQDNELSEKELKDLVFVYMVGR